MCVSTLMVIAYVTPFFIAVVVPLSTTNRQPCQATTPPPRALTSSVYMAMHGMWVHLTVVVYWLCMQFYRNTSRELQRLDSISRSPVYTHFSETLNGVDSVRAYKVTGRFIGTSESRPCHTRSKDHELT